MCRASRSPSGECTRIVPSPSATTQFRWPLPSTSIAAMGAYVSAFNSGEGWTNEHHPSE
jgi:hypothetical protein